MLSLELCRCSSDFFLSSRLRNRLATKVGMVEARSVNMHNIHTNIINHSTYEFVACNRVKFPPNSGTLRTS